MNFRSQIPSGCVGQGMESSRVQALGHWSFRSDQPALSQEGWWWRIHWCFLMVHWTLQQRLQLRACRKREHSSHLQFTELLKRGRLDGLQDASRYTRSSRNLTVALPNLISSFPLTYNLEYTLGLCTAMVHFPIVGKCWTTVLSSRLYKAQRYE